jgi:L-rhamnose mutarotase
MRIALHSVIADGAVHHYRTHHARVPDELTALFSRAGIRDWVIWRSGDRLFHLVDCDDWDAAMAVVGPDPANARWQADIGRFVAGFRDADGEDEFAPLENVWSLAEQRAAAAG